MNLSQKVLFSTAVQIVGRLASLAIALVALRLVTMYLGVEGFGQYAIVVALSEMVLVMSDLGIATVLVRESARHPERVSELGATLLWIRIVGSAVLLVLSLSVIPLLPYDATTKRGLAIGFLSVFITALSLFPLPFFQVHLQFAYIVALEVAARGITLVIIGAVVVLDLGFYAIVASAGLASAATLPLAFFLSRFLWNVRGKPSRDLARSTLRVAAPLGLLAVLSLIHHKGGLLILSVVQTPEDVGIYAIAFRIYEMCTLVPWMFMAAVFPLLAVYLYKRDPLARVTIERAVSFLMLVIAPVAVTIVLYADTLIDVVSSEDFADAAAPLRVLAFALPFSAANTVFAFVLIALNRQRILLFLALGAVSLNVAVNAYVIPRYSYMGAASVTVFSEAIGCLGALVLATRAYYFRLSASFMARVIVAALAMAVTILVLRESLHMAAALAGGAIYLTFAYATRVITPNDVNRLLRRSSE